MWRRSLNKTIESWISANSLVCDNCVQIGDLFNRTCVNETCGLRLDRCAAMSFTLTINGSTVKSWVKRCQNHHVCNFDNATMCKVASNFNSSMQALGGMQNCNMVCSTANDLDIPPPVLSPTRSPIGNSASVAISVSAVTTFVVYSAVMFYQYM